MKKISKKINYITILTLVIFFGFSFYAIRGETSIFSLEKKTYFVGPDGSDSNSGLSANEPFGTIQKAVDLAEPGETVYLLNGEYKQDLVSNKNGHKNSPIIIRGEREAVVRGGGGVRVVEINHNYVYLLGFTIDGLFSKDNSPDSYRDKLIYVEGTKENNGITGVKIEKMEIKNAGGECVRLKGNATRNEILRNKISNCGVYDFKFDGEGKNGEGIYIGTAPEQTNDEKNKMNGPDNSRENWVHDNEIDTQGNECVDIKESSSGNVVENNKCTGQKDSKSAGLDSRGNENIFRNNEIFGNAGAGVRLGGDSDRDGLQNSVYGNLIKDNKSGGIKIERMPQSQICNNIFEDNSDKEFTGEYREEAEREYGKNCPFSLKFKIIEERFRELF